MTENEERCRQYHLSGLERSQPELSKGRVLDESLNHFVNQRPAGTN